MQKQLRNIHLPPFLRLCRIDNFLSFLFDEIVVKSSIWKFCLWENFLTKNSTLFNRMKTAFIFSILSCVSFRNLYFSKGGNIDLFGLFIWCSYLHLYIYRKCSPSLDSDVRKLCFFLDNLAWLGPLTLLVFLFYFNVLASDFSGKAKGGLLKPVSFHL